MEVQPQLTAGMATKPNPTYQTENPLATGLAIRKSVVKRSGRGSEVFRKLTAIDKDGSGDIDLPELLDFVDEEIKVATANMRLRRVVAVLATFLVVLLGANFGLTWFAIEAGKETHASSGHLETLDGRLVATGTAVFSVDLEQYALREGAPNLDSLTTVGFESPDGKDHMRVVTGTDKSDCIFSDEDYLCLDVFTESHVLSIARDRLEVSELAAFKPAAMEDVPDLDDEIDHDSPIDPEQEIVLEIAHRNSRRSLNQVNDGAKYAVIAPFQCGDALCTSANSYDEVTDISQPNGDFSAAALSKTQGPTLQVLGGAINNGAAQPIDDCAEFWSVGHSVRGDFMGFAYQAADGPAAVEIPPALSCMLSVDKNGKRCQWKSNRFPAGCVAGHKLFKDAGRDADATAYWRRCAFDGLNADGSERSADVSGGRCVAAGQDECSNGRSSEFCGPAAKCKNGPDGPLKNCSCEWAVKRRNGRHTPCSKLGFMTSRYFKCMDFTYEGITSSRSGRTIKQGVCIPVVHGQPKAKANAEPMYAGMGGGSGSGK